MKEKSRVIVSMTLLLSLSLGNILAPIKAFSSKENRYLQGLPDLNYKSIISGKFGKEFETFTTDQFIFRDKWISLKTLGDLGLLKKDNGRVYFGKDDYLFDLDKEIDEEELERNIKGISSLVDKMKVVNIRVDGILVPSKSTLLKDKLPKYAPIIREEDIVKTLGERLGEKISFLDLEQVLGPRTSEYIYYKTDHHWTSKAAFYAYEAYMKSLGLEPLKEEEFKIEEVSKDFLGTNYRKANYYRGEADRIHIYQSDQLIEGLYDREFLNKTDKYSYFLGGDKPLMEINTSVKNGENILVIKDSFANSFIPFLTNHYEKIIVVDPRYYRGSVMDLVEEKEIRQVLFLFNVQNYGKEKSLAGLGK